MTWAWSDVEANMTNRYFLIESYHLWVKKLATFHNLKHVEITIDFQSLGWILPLFQSHRFQSPQGLIYRVDGISFALSEFFRRPHVWMHHAFSFSSHPEVYSTEQTTSTSLGIRLLVPRSMDDNDVVPFQGHRQAQKKIFDLRDSSHTFVQKTKQLFHITVIP